MKNWISSNKGALIRLLRSWNQETRFPRGGFQRSSSFHASEKSRQGNFYREILRITLAEYSSSAGRDKTPKNTVSREEASPAFNIQKQRAPRAALCSTLTIFPRPRGLNNAGPEIPKIVNQPRLIKERGRGAGVNSRREGLIRGPADARLFAGAVPSGLAPFAARR